MRWRSIFLDRLFERMSRPLGQQIGAGRSGRLDGKGQGCGNLSDHPEPAFDFCRLGQHEGDGLPIVYRRQ
jgi:hypothetical protein